MNKRKKKSAPKLVPHAHRAVYSFPLGNKEVMCAFGSATQGMWCRKWPFFPVALCMKITLKKCLKWWDSEIAVLSQTLLV